MSKLEYADQKFSTSGNFADESTSSMFKHSSEWKFTHSPSNLDTSYKGSITKDDNSIKADVQWLYLLAADNKVKNHVLKLDINKERRSFLYEVKYWINAKFLLHITDLNYLAARSHKI